MKANFTQSILLLILAIGSGVKLNAQDKNFCQFDHTFQEQMKIYPGAKEDMEKANALISNFNHMDRSDLHKLNYVIENNDTIYEIPCVVHVLHTGGAIGSNYNPTDANIIAWVNYLNNTLAANYGSYPNPTNGGVKFPIRYKLAQIDENCNITNGINRVNLSSNATYVASGLQYGSNSNPGVNEATMRAAARWNPNYYYNIYLVNMFNGNDGYGGGSYMTGYAYYPAHFNFLYDASVMLARAAVVGWTTFPHEIGHSLGLFHTFEGGVGTNNCPPLANCSTTGDLVCDTEPGVSLFSAPSCPTNSDINPCTSLPYNNVQYNIMNYGQCLNRFTPGQVTRSLEMLKFFRRDLMNSVTNMPPIPPSFTGNATNVNRPTGPNPNTNNNYEQGFITFNMGTIRYSGQTTNIYHNNYYYDNTNKCQYFLRTKFEEGATVPVEYTTSSFTSRAVFIYIDFNNDDLFTANELVLTNLNNVGSGNQSPIVLSDNVTIPTGVATKNVPLKMRVICQGHNITPTPNNTILEYGSQVVDFSVMIVDPTPLNIIVRDLNVAQKNCTNIVTYDLKFEQTQEIAIIEKSEDAVNYTSVKTITSSEPKGSFVDYFTQNKQAFYRLKLINEQQDINYSKVVRVNNNCYNDTDIEVLPNPNDGNFKVQTNNKTIIKTVNIINMYGQIVKSIAVGQTTTLVDLSSYANGNYVVEAVTDNGNIYRKIVTKQ